jgi:tetraacyldisaccharide 4'-kinase
VAVLSRGYKRKSRGFIIAEDTPDPKIIGDEPAQIKRKYPDVIVAVDERRRRGIEKLLKLNPSPDVILLDDAYQHRYVKAGLSILLDDFSKPMDQDFLLPFGRLREPVSEKKRANIILVTRSPVSLKAIDMRMRAKHAMLDNFQHLYYTSMTASEVKGVFSGDFNLFRNSKPEILLVTGIANPRSVKPFARKISTRIKELSYPDHHAYSEKDLDRIISELTKMDPLNSILLTTEKDAVKLEEYEARLQAYADRIFSVGISVKFLNNDENNFNNQIISYVRSNKRNSILHKNQN